VIDNSIDSIVTHATPTPEWYRILKPGAFACVGTPAIQSYKTSIALENIGLEIRDVVTYLCSDGIEHWILARKPISENTIALNVMKWETGVLNIDVSRVPTSDKMVSGRHIQKSRDYPGGYKDVARTEYTQNKGGRFPSNLILAHAQACGIACVPECPVRQLDKQSLDGGMHSAGGARPNRRDTRGKGNGLFTLHGKGGHRLGDEGGASRFFHTELSDIKAYFIQLLTPPDGFYCDPA